MKKTTLYVFLGSVFLLGFGLACKKASQLDYPISSVPFMDIRLTDAFWGPRIETNRTVSIPFAFKQSETTGRIKNFEIAGGLAQGAFCTKYPFDDSDVFKIIEGASYSLMVNPDPQLEKDVDEVIAKIAAAQEEDGYLYTARTINPANPPVDWVGKERWSNLYMSHELYNLGHLYEAAVAHFRATGKRSLLNVALKSADLVVRTFGPKKRRGAPGHQEIEIGLVKLYRQTGKKKYLNLAKFFLDERGKPEGRKLYGEYSQDHKPVTEQSEAVGHAVRALYMYSGMADVAALTGDTAYLQALDRVWRDIAFKKIYLTGGVGAAGGIEGFGPGYELPNAEAYCETCASIAQILWNYRMFLLSGESKYIDILERTLYNGFLSGVGMSGDLFFYPNPLASFGQHHRSPWFNCACCPSNVTRFVPQIPGYVYATRDDSVFVNLFVSSEASVRLGGQKIGLQQQAAFPWGGDVKIVLTPERAADFNVLVRIPGWAMGRPVPSDLYQYAGPGETVVSVRVNGEEVPQNMNHGYAVLRRVWKAGDTIDISFSTPVQRTLSHPDVQANLGRVAFERGPLVYCAEWADNGGQVSNLVLDDTIALTPEFREGLLNGVTVIKGQATALQEVRPGGPIARRKQAFVAIPYYAWAHRGKGEMMVWLAREEPSARPLPRPTIASGSRASASGEVDASGLNDLWDPLNSIDRSHPYVHWWPNKGTQEWVQYDFPSLLTVSSVELYWFDDTGQGECRIPESWRVLYKIGEDWQPVQNLDGYGLEKDVYNRVRFRPVMTRALRLDIQLPKDFSAGVLEWRVR